MPIWLRLRWVAGLSLLPALLAGCNGESQDADGATSSTPSASASTADPLNTDAHITEHHNTSSVDGAASDGDLVAEHQRGLAQIHGIAEPYPVSVVQRVAPSQQSDLVAECMRERGWIVEVDRDGGVSANAPDQQVPALNESWYVCWASYPPLDQYLRPLDQDQLERLYDYYYGELTVCLRAEGFAIDPPSRQSWLEQAAVGESWMPYFDIGETPSVELLQRCPAQPPESMIFPAG